MTQDGPAGLRILVVEDEMLIAVLIEEMLQGLGCHVVGPVSRLDAALRLAHEEPLDAAILDVRIRGGQVYPVVKNYSRETFRLCSPVGTVTGLSPRAFEISRD